MCVCSRNGQACLTLLSSGISLARRPCAPWINIPHLDEHHVLVVHDDDLVRVVEPENGTVRQEYDFACSVIAFASE